MRTRRTAASLLSRAALLRGPCAAAIVLAAAGCTVAPPPGTPVSPRVEVLPGDARAAQWGVTAAEILAHPDVRAEVRLLFGEDWAGAGGARPRAAAAEFFGRSAAPLVLKIDGADYVAAAGCAPAACADRRGLVLIRVDGAVLHARLDQAGFSRYYARGAALGPPPRSHALLDAAWRAAEPPR